jgi:hypothetical protein
MSLLDSMVIYKASTGELSGSLSMASAGISIASTKKEKENLLSYNKIKKGETKS